MVVIEVVSYSGSIAIEVVSWMACLKKPERKNGLPKIQTGK